MKLVLLLALSGAPAWEAGVCAGGTSGPLQVITPQPVNVGVREDTEFTLKVSYTTENPVDETLTGLGLRMHFNSSQLEFLQLESVFGLDPPEPRFFTIVGSEPQDDTNNADGDPDTDLFVNVAWVDVNGEWPGEGSTPQLLYAARFRTLETFAEETTVNFSATSTAAGYTLDATSANISPVPEISVAPTQLDFGAVRVGESSALEVTITNDGNAVLDVTGIALGPGTSAAFAKTAGPASISLPPDGSTVVEVTYAPLQADQVDTGTLLVESNDPDEPVVTVELAGTSVEGPEIDVAPTLLAFGDVPVGETRQLDVTITNVGGGVLAVSRIAISAESSPTFAQASGPTMVDLGADESVVVGITYRPVEAGVLDAGELIIESNDLDEGVVTVPLTGVGLGEPLFRRGDCNADAFYDISDPIYLLNYLFGGGETPPCRKACNASFDDGLDLSDPIYILNNLFGGGPLPPEPGPFQCGSALDEMTLDCLAFEPCAP